MPVFRLPSAFCLSFLVLVVFLVRARGRGGGQFNLLGEVVVTAHGIEMGVSSELFLECFILTRKRIISE